MHTSRAPSTRTSEYNNIQQIYSSVLTLHLNDMACTSLDKQLHFAINAACTGIKIYKDSLCKYISGIFLKCHSHFGLLMISMNGSFSSSKSSANTFKQEIRIFTIVWCLIFPLVKVVIWNYITVCSYTSSRAWQLWLTCECCSVNTFCLKFVFHFPKLAFQLYILSS